MWTIGKAASTARVSVRTLHHYDEIGLLSPSHRSAADYRLYTAEDMLRLGQILFFKEMGFSLERIQELMDDPSFDQAQALRLQRSYLQEKVGEYSSKITAIETALAKIEMKRTTNRHGESDTNAAETSPADKNRKEGTRMSTLNPDFNDKDIEDLFGDFDPREYEKEAEQRWGETNAYAESARRTAKYTKEDWARMNAKLDAINTRLATMFANKQPLDSPEMLEAVGDHRAYITQSFYDCGIEIYEGLGQMYIGDPRFTKNLNKVAPGFAQNLHDAIMVYVEHVRSQESDS